MKTFFLGMEQELLIIKETSGGYDCSSHLKESQPTRLAFDPQNENRIYCSTFDSGLWKSENGGDSWNRIGQEKSDDGEFLKNQIQTLKVTAVAVHPLKKSVTGNSLVYAGTEPSKLYYSEDTGETWKEFKGIQDLPSKEDWSFPPRPQTHYVRWIAPSFSHENGIGVSIEAGAFIRTENHGKTWEDRPAVSPIDIHTLLAHPQSPGRLYAACGDGVSHNERAYAESKDEGNTWQYLGKGTEAHPYLYHMALNPEDPEDRLVSASRNASKAHRSPLYSTVYRKNGNQPWKEVAEGLPCEGAFTHNLAADPEEAGVFYTLNNFGVFQLNTGETVWKKLDIKWRKEYLNQQPSCFEVKNH